MLIPFDDLFSRYQIKTGMVVHAGAHWGEEAQAYDRQGIKQVVWIEALPEVYHRLVKQIAPYPGQFALCACLSDTDDQEVIFHVASNEGQSSSFLEFGTHAVEHPSVRFVREVPMKTIRLDTLLQQQHVEVLPGSFLNMDLQGVELLALKGAGQLLSKFDYAYIEVNAKELYKGCALVAEVDGYLAQFGLLGREVKMTGAGWGDKFYQRSRN